MTPDIEDSALRLSPAFRWECKAAASGRIEGLASVFGEPDAHGHVIRNGAFRETLDQHRANRTKPAMLWAHDDAQPVGRWTSLRETSEGLAATGQMNLKTEAGREAFEHVSAGDVTGLSIGFLVSDGGSERQRGTRIITRLELFEISLVTVPAARRAQIREVHSLGSRADLRNVLRESGLSRSQAERAATSAWRSINPEAAMAETISAIRAATLKLKQR